MSIRIVGDVHGRYSKYWGVIKDCEYSFQVGDMGFDYQQLDQLDVTKHYAIKGNHDSYAIDGDHRIFCGDYGQVHVENRDIFFVRGGFSIDRKWRSIGIDYFEEEELSHEELGKAIELYEKVKPKITITHEGPFDTIPYCQSIADFPTRFGFPPGPLKTRTNMALNQMFAIHKPSLWIFGHMHCRREFNIEGTEFVCLDMLRDRKDNSNSYYDL